MAILDKKPYTVRESLQLPLIIPDYQRPYKWQAQHVNQLLDDLFEQQQREQKYRLGTVVLHKHTKELNNWSIVDGQQRLLTLSLLSQLLAANDDDASTLLTHEFSSSISITNLHNNALLIKNRIDMLGDSEQKVLSNFINDKCELIVIKLSYISEAFQFFDSQNARGKDLAPHDLLKAFHLREMVEDENIQQQTVQRWESSINKQGALPQLSIMMADYLFPIRRWAGAKSGLHFTKTKVDVFKGVSLNQTSYPYIESLKALDFMITHYNQQTMRKWDDQQRAFPFQINQTMINGKRFFEFVEHYINDYKTLFIDPCPALKELLDVIEASDGKYRVGDQYVKTLFYCAVLFYHDKFGDVKLKEAAMLCFRWSYSVRLNHQRVAMSTIDNHATHTASIFRWINDAQYHYQALAMPLIPVAENKASKVDNIANVLGVKTVAKK